MENIKKRQEMVEEIERRQKMLEEVIELLNKTKYKNMYEIRGCRIVVKTYDTSCKFKSDDWYVYGDEFAFKDFSGLFTHEHLLQKLSDHSKIWSYDNFITELVDKYDWCKLLSKGVIFVEEYKNGEIDGYYNIITCAGEIHTGWNNGLIDFNINKTKITENNYQLVEVIFEMIDEKLKENDE